MTPDPLPTSGAQDVFETGARRDAGAGKGRYDLLPPCVILRDALRLEHGAALYGDRNWENGQPLSRFVSSALRHIFKHLEGHRDEDHLAAARWNLAGLMFVEEMIARGRLPAELNDLPNHMP